MDPTLRSWLRRGFLLLKGIRTSWSHSCAARNGNDGRSDPPLEKGGAGKKRRALVEPLAEDEAEERGVARDLEANDAAQLPDAPGTAILNRVPRRP